MLLLNGPPDGRLEFRCTNVTYPMEIWFYDGSERVAYEFYLIFVQKTGQRASGCGGRATACRTCSTP